MSSAEERTNTETPEEPVRLNVTETKSAPPSTTSGNERQPHPSIVTSSASAAELKVPMTLKVSEEREIPEAPTSED